MKSIIPTLALATSVALTGCADPWKKDIPRLRATVAERQSALLDLRNQDINKLLESGYIPSQTCPTIFLKQGVGPGNSTSLAKIYSVVVSKPENGDHFYEKLLTRQVAHFNANNQGIYYSYHPASDFTGKILFDELIENSLSCEPDDFVLGHYRKSFLTEHIKGTQALEKPPSNRRDCWLFHKSE